MSCLLLLNLVPTADQHKGRMQTALFSAATKGAKEPHLASNLLTVFAEANELAVAVTLFIPFQCQRIVCDTPFREALFSRPKNAQLCNVPILNAKLEHTTLFDIV